MDRSRSPRRGSPRHVVVLPIKAHPCASAIPRSCKRSYPYQWGEEAEAHSAALCELDRYNAALALFVLVAKNSTSVAKKSQEFWIFMGLKVKVTVVQISINTEIKVVVSYSLRMLRSNPREI